MSNVPADLLYAESHEWLKLEGDIATIGITDHAQAALGDLVYVELPHKAKQVKQGQNFVVVESVKAASEVYAPVSGEVVDVNDALLSAPELINKGCYGEGWIVKIKISDKGELAKLIDAAKYQALVG